MQRQVFRMIGKITLKSPIGTCKKMDQRHNPQTSHYELKQSTDSKWRLTDYVM